MRVALNNLYFRLNRSARLKRAEHLHTKHHARTAVYAKQGDIVADPLRTRRIVARYQQTLETRMTRVASLAARTVRESFKAQQAEAQPRVAAARSGRVGRVTVLDPDKAGVEFESYLNETFMEVLLDAELAATVAGPGHFLVGINSQVIGVAAVQAFERARAAGIPVALELEEFVRNVRSATPADVAATRQFGLLRNMSFETGDAMRDELVRGLRAGQSANEIADTITSKLASVNRTRARVIARTEVTFAHAEATLNGLQQAGVTHVEPLVEFTLNVHGSADPCPICIDLSGQIYFVENAKGVIPVHANCQCGWVPREARYLSRRAQ